MLYFRSIVRSIAYYNINFVIKILIISDFLFWSAYQLLAPFFAIYVTDNITGGSISVIGISTALYFIFKSIFEVPVGIYIDKSKSEKDDLYTSLYGGLVMGIIYFSFVFINSVWQLYALEIALGIAAAFSYPGWCSIFTRHIDKGKEGYEWSIYDIVLGLGMAGAAVVGAFITDKYGFKTLFMVVGTITLLSSILLYFIKDQIYYRSPRKKHRKTKKTK